MTQFTTFMVSCYRTTIRPLLGLMSACCLIFLLTTCNKPVYKPDPDNLFGLPNATQSGANTFGYTMNGQSYAIDMSQYLAGSYSPQGLFVSGTYFNTQNITMNIGILGSAIKTNSPYDLSDTTKAFALVNGTGVSCFVNINANAGQGNFHVYALGGSATITRADSTQRILSGTFACTLLSPFCDTLHVENGRFDIKY